MVDRDHEPTLESLFADPEHCIKSFLLRELGGLSSLELSWSGERTTQGRHWWLLSGCKNDMWPTPSSQGSSGEISPDLVRKGAKLMNAKTGRILQSNLATEVKWHIKAAWPTPRATDWKDGRRGNDPRHGRTLSEDAKHDNPLSNMKLNPDWVAQLMGAPEGWLDV